MVSCAAATTVAYLDFGMNAKVDVDGSGLVPSKTEDLAVTIISAGTLINDKYKIGAEYGVGTIDPSNDLTLWSVKAGYRFVNATAFKVDAIIAPINITTETGELNATMYGVDLAQYFSKSIFLTATYVVSTGTCKNDGYKTDNSVPTRLIRVKFNYFFNDSIGMVAGYTGLDYKSDMVMLNNFNVGKADVNLGGPTLGVVYKF